MYGLGIVILQAEYDGYALNSRHVNKDDNAQEIRILNVINYQIPEFYLNSCI